MHLQKVRSHRMNPAAAFHKQHARLLARRRRPAGEKREDFPAPSREAPLLHGGQHAFLASRAGFIQGRLEQAQEDVGPPQARLHGPLDEDGRALQVPVAPGSGKQVIKLLGDLVRRRRIALGVGIDFPLAAFADAVGQEVLPEGLDFAHKPLAVRAPSEHNDSCKYLSAV